MLLFGVFIAIFCGRRAGLLKRSSAAALRDPGKTNRPGPVSVGKFSDFASVARKCADHGRGCFAGSRLCATRLGSFGIQNLAGNSLIYVELMIVTGVALLFSNVFFARAFSLPDLLCICHRPLQR